jgi:hypothetical protein
VYSIAYPTTEARQNMRYAMKIVQSRSISMSMSTSNATDVVKRTVSKV